MMRSFFFALALVIGVGLSMAAPVFAQQPVTDDDVNRIARQLFCPVCENVPLDVCPTEACAQWRATIREKLEAGWSDEQIKDYFVQQYGERVLALPSARGFNLSVYVIPPVAVLIGLIGLWFFLRQRKQLPMPTATETTAPVINDEYAARLEQELKQRQ